jgi:iron-sulfur cluster repair protein YtfE (RIC family)
VAVVTVAGIDSSPSFRYRFLIRGKEMAMATVSVSTDTPVTVNAAFLQEIKEVNQELWQHLANIREVCSNAGVVGQHTAQLVDMLVELRDQLALHFALEEAYGYFELSPSSVALNSDQASRLRAEHRQLYALATQLAEEGEQLQFEGNCAKIMTVLPARFHQLDFQLMQHEHRENELIMRQSDDIGVGD